MPNLTVNVGATVTIQFDAVTSSGSVSIQGGLFSTNNQSQTWSSYVVGAGASARTITLGSSTINLTSTGQALSSSGIAPTFAANTAVITISGNGASYSGGSVNWNGTSFVITGSGVFAWTGSGQTGVANLTRTGTVAKTDGISFNANLTISGTLTLNANSSVNRLLILSSLVGTSRTITAASLVCTNVIAFQDITGAGAATWTTAASGATAFGDCQGNSGITFTPAVTRYGVVAGNGSSTAMWSTTSGGAGGASVPLPQDTMILDANSAAGTYTMDMPRLGVSLTCTGFTQTLALTSVANTLFGNLTLGAAMTITGSAANTLTLAGRSAQTLGTAGVSLNSPVTIKAPNGTYTLQSALTCSGNAFLLAAGGYADAGFSTTADSFSIILVAPGTVNMTGTGFLTNNTSNKTVWNAVAANLTVTSLPSAISVSTAATFTRTFAGGGLSYSATTLIYTVANSPGPLAVTGANTFGTVNIGSGRVLTMPASTTNPLTTLAATGARNGYQVFPGVAGHYASTPDAAPLDITGDITLWCKAAEASWTAILPWCRSGPTQHQRLHICS
jgi:hypothetical protein